MLKKQTGYELTNKPSGLENEFLQELRQIITDARGRAYTAINLAQVESNWLVGKRIVEQEQNGSGKAEYGKRVIALASEALTQEFGKGYSKTNIRNFRRFYLEFSESFMVKLVDYEQVEKEQTVSAQLSWSHYERLMRVVDKQARTWYLQQATEQMWSFRTLNRNISTQYYERMLSSQMNKLVEQEMIDNTKVFESDKFSFIKNPTVLEFLGLAANLGHTEQDIEKAILTNLQNFMMELGSGFAFVARQELIKTESKNYFIDLVFYNFKLKCFVLIDLKLGQVTHQDIGQMDMYVRMFDELKRGEGDNPTIGIVLCSETDVDIARYSILKGNEQLFATKYQLYLPTVKQLQDEVKRQTEIVRQQLLKEAEVVYGCGF